MYGFKMNQLPNWIKWSKVKGKYIILKKKNNIVP